MANKCSKPKIEKTAADSATKGKLVEFIVASMHKVPGVDVQLNVKLPALNSKQKRRREIDVLLTSKVSGYPVRIAIECKNYKEVIGVDLIDKFIGHLKDVGVPTQNSVYVTARHFTKGAIERAEKEQIRLLQLTGLTQDRMAAYLQQAIQTYIHLMLRLDETEISWNVEPVIDVPGIPDSGPTIFYDKNGQQSFCLPDELWLSWIAGHFTCIGKYRVEFHLPPDWYVVYDEKALQVSSLITTVKVAAFVTTIPGQFSHHTLINAQENIIEKTHTHISFAPVNGTCPIVRIKSEKELAAYLQKQPEFVKLSIRGRVPRIETAICYWPPSSQAEGKLNEQWASYEAGTIPNQAPMDAIEIEGSDLSAGYEAWSEDYRDYFLHRRHPKPPCPMTITYIPEQ